MFRMPLRMLVAALLALVVLAPMARALTVEVERPREHEGYLWVDL